MSTTDMERSATFLLMLDRDEDEVLAALMDLHPYETEVAMRAAIASGVERKQSFERAMSEALDKAALQEEHHA